MKAEDIKITKQEDIMKGSTTRYPYRSTHDIRPTAPNGTLWYVSKVEDGMAHLWNWDGVGRVVTALVFVDDLHDDVAR